MNQFINPTPFVPSEVEGLVRAKPRTAPAEPRLRSAKSLDFARDERMFVIGGEL